MTFVKLLLTHFTYVALILVLLAAGLGTPIPEDVPLAFSGFLCNKKYSPLKAIVPVTPADTQGDMDDSDSDTMPDAVIPTVDLTARVPHVYLMIAAGMIGVLAGDSMVFFFGRRGMRGKSFVARHLQKVLHSKRREKVERHFANHGNWTVFTGRFFPGARSIVFAFAGMSKMSYARFVMIDGMAAAISVPLFVLIGFFFAANIEHLFDRINHVKHIVIPCVLVVMIGALVFYLVRKRRAAVVAPTDQT